MFSFFRLIQENRIFHGLNASCFILQYNIRFLKIKFIFLLFVSVPRAGKPPPSQKLKISIVLKQKNPGVELLSRTLLCSTIVVRPLIDRVRDGNVSCKPAVDTGNKYVRRSKIEGEELSGQHNLLSWNILKCYLSWRACLFSCGSTWRSIRKKKGGQASRRISTGKLKTLLFLHIRPIEVVVCDPPSGE